MSPIPAWLRRQWDVWDVRVLVLSSLTFQIILFIFGNRRKYNSSLWLNMVVWLAYLLADSVATVALGKLSDAQGDHDDHDGNNVLPAIWAPLLLLHLGGPDTITAYSLEDNRLWMRHLMGLGVQATVAVYVIYMSWRKALFSYLSLPAFVAGMIKYGERVWVLKSASDDNSRNNIVPFSNLPEVIIDGPYKNTDGGEYVGALVIAHQLVRDFKLYMDNYDISRFEFFRFHPLVMNVKYSKGGDQDTLFWDALEVETGLMYDLFYTKASITYTKRGCIMRSISFVCTMSVLVGLFWVIFRKEKWHHKHYDDYSMIDIAITGVLLVGALALEIYAVAVILSSDWTMLGLIFHKKVEWVIQLRRKFPWFYQKKYWSKKVGQFDLLGFCIKENKPAKFSCSSRILGLLGLEDKLNKYMHQTRVVVPSDLYRIALDYFHDCSIPSSPGVGKLDEVAQGSLISMMKFFDPHPPAFHQLVIIFHLATEICDHLELNISSSQQAANSSGSGNDKQFREVSRTLSRYMMYLLLMCPSALPIILSDTELGVLIHDLKELIKDEQDVTRACEMLKDYSIKLHPESLRCILLVVQEFVNNFWGWEKLGSLWLGMLSYAAIKGQKNYNLEQLRQGGELLTLFWFFIPQSNILDRIIDFTKLGKQINNQVAQLIDRNNY